MEQKHLSSEWAVQLLQLHMLDSQLFLCGFRMQLVKLSTPRAVPLNADHCCHSVETRVGQEVLIWETPGSISKYGFLTPPRGGTWYPGSDGAPSSQRWTTFPFLSLPYT